MATEFSGTAPFWEMRGFAGAAALSPGRGSSSIVTMSLMIIIVMV